MSKLVALHLLAHARTGDKGNRANISLICYRPPDYALLEHMVTCEFVADIFEGRRPSAVRRYELPHLCALNFVLDAVLEGGVNASLGLDGHGKSLSFRLLSARILVPFDHEVASFGEDDWSCPVKLVRTK